LNPAITLLLYVYSQREPRGTLPHASYSPIPRCALPPAKRKTMIPDAIPGLWFPILPTQTLCLTTHSVWTEYEQHKEGTMVPATVSPGAKPMPKPLTSQRTSALGPSPPLLGLPMPETPDGSNSVRENPHCLIGATTSLVEVATH
jgi:hypothetical protein